MGDGIESSWLPVARRIFVCPMKVVLPNAQEMLAHRAQVTIVQVRAAFALREMGALGYTHHRGAGPGRATKASGGKSGACQNRTSLARS